MKRNEVSYYAIKRRLQKAKEFHQTGQEFRAWPDLHGQLTSWGTIHRSIKVTLKRPYGKKRDFLVAVTFYTVQKGYVPYEVKFSISLRSPTLGDFVSQFWAMVIKAEEMGVFKVRRGIL